MIDRTAFTWIAEAENKTDAACSLATAMVEWFLAHYEDPAENTPYDDGYVYLCGGPYDAREELSGRFPAEPGANFSDDEWDEIIEVAVGKIEDEGGPEWAKIIRGDFGRARDAGERCPRSFPDWQAGRRGLSHDQD